MIDGNVLRSVVTLIDLLNKQYLKSLTDHTTPNNSKLIMQYRSSFELGTGDANATVCQPVSGRYSNAEHKSALEESHLMRFSKCGLCFFLVALATFFIC